ncbi:MAG TPA: choice-of-anchor J domain-containing protein [Flavobacteriaceae bacterium]|nr:choice-of-anchor J domain-containing protein [Flavobacteriaceae bacterium]
MKKIIYCLAILGTVFIGCNPMEDIYNDIDAVEKPILGTDTYTLTSEDYDDLGLTFGNFSSEEDAKTMLPSFLAEMYPYWGEGSSVLVNYDLFIGSAEGVSDYSGADVYQLTNADYASTGSDAFGFYPNVDATTQIPDVLDAQIAGPTEGQIVLARYNQYFDTPEVGLATVFEAGFNGDLSGFEAISAVGDAEMWEAAAFGGVEYAYMSGFSGGAQDNEDWLISPAIDLSGESNLKLQINQAINYASDLSLLNVLVSADYSTGTDPALATWETINLATIPPGNNWTFVESEDYDISAYDGQTIYVAFTYESNTSEAASWEIDFLKIKALGVSGEANSKGEHFVYSGGSWEAVDGVYFLSSADFDSMGEDSGQPGRFDNFGSSTPAEDYLPTFLSLTAPWAYSLDDDEVIMVYDYFSSSSGAQIRGNRYTKIDGEWTPHMSVISTSLQFGHDGSTWVPDNTIRYDLTGADIAFISNAFIDIYPGPAANVLQFGSFDRRSSSGNYWSEEMLLEAFNALLENGNFVTAEEQKYVLTYIVYTGATGPETMAVIKTGGEWVYQ